MVSHQAGGKPLVRHRVVRNLHAKTLKLNGKHCSFLQIISLAAALF